MKSETFDVVERHDVHFHAYGIPQVELRVQGFVGFRVYGTLETRLPVMYWGSILLVRMCRDSKLLRSFGVFGITTHMHLPSFHMLSLSLQAFVITCIVPRSQHILGVGVCQDRVALLLCLSDRRRPRGSSHCPRF